jgi:hypothetical protein
MFAYLDPGVGSLVLQAWVAALLGGLFVLKASWRHVRDRLWDRP